MTQSIIEKSPLFDVRARIALAVGPDDAYRVISDLPRSGEWSEECLGGQWVSGRPATVDAIFQGENRRSEDVVGWAPVVRGVWHTQARVVAAEPGRTFRWAMLTKSGETQQSVWGFDIEPDGDGSVLIHHFRMDRPTEGITGIVSGLDEQERVRFFREWGEKLEQDIARTLERIKKVIEQ